MKCAECPAEISGNGKTGLCRPCFCRRLTSDPVINAKRLARHREAQGTPDARRANSISALAYFRDNPDARIQRAEQARRDYDKTLGSPKAKAAAARPEVIAKRAKTYSDNRLAWCPPEHRDEYRRLLYVKQVGASEAKRIILDEISREPGPTKFERAMEAVKNGAPIRTEAPMPSRADPTYSLVGCGTALL